MDVVHGVLGLLLVVSSFGGFIRALFTKDRDEKLDLSVGAWGAAILGYLFLHLP